MGAVFSDGLHVAAICMLPHVTACCCMLPHVAVLNWSVAAAYCYHADTFGV